MEKVYTSQNPSNKLDEHAMNVFSTGGRIYRLDQKELRRGEPARILSGKDYFR